MIRFAVFMFAFYSLVFPFRASAYGFRLVSYNVENLFDCHHAGTEYDEYIPGGKYGWNETLFKKKIANLSKVLIAVKGDILALQEVESEAALLALRDYLIQKGENYQYFAIAGGINSTVKCALLSKFPISAKKEIPINYKGLRSVLRADIDIKGHNFTVYVNHWKSMRGPESLRVKSAETLMTDARRLSASHDYVFAGDFNSDYDAGTAFSGSKKNNDTNGITGINHVLKTIAGGVQVTGKMLSNDKKNLIHYNLWNELPEKKRWSYNFYGKKSALDSIIVSKGLYDNRGISYTDNSFGRFMPSWLFKKKAVFRWQISRKHKLKHTGKGFSDHLPVYADFSV